MATVSITVLRRSAGLLFTLLLAVCFCVEAVGQSSAPPTVLSNTTAAPFNAATQNGVSFSAVWNIAVSQQGDILVEDFSAGSIYQIPADGRPTITITNGGMGGWGVMGIAVDPQNNIIIGCANWCGSAYLIPYDAANKTWNFSKYIAWGNSANVGWYHMDAEATNSSGVLAFGNEGGSLYTIPTTSVVNGAGGVLTPASASLKSRATQIAIDDAGNIAWMEGAGGNPPATSVYWISAATAALGTATEATALDISTSNGSSAVQAAKGTAANGVAFDAAGNAYISDANIGVYVVPNEGGIPNPAHSYLLSNVAATNGLAIDRFHGTLIVPTTETSTANAQWENAGYFAVIKFGAGEVGTLNVGQAQPAAYSMPAWGQFPSGSTSVWYNFFGSISPAQFVFQEDGVPGTQDFEMVNLSAPGGGTFKTPQCALGTQYAAGTSCFVQAALNPQASGNASAQLLMQTEQPVSSADADYSATVTGYSAANGILTLTAPNGFVPYELVTFNVSSTTPTSPLAPLQGKSFSVLGNGLSPATFEIKTSAVTGSGTNSTATPLATTATGVYTYTTVASTTLHGTGVAPNVNVTPAMESTAATGLKAPGQMTVDAQGNIYVADAVLGKVVEFGAGSGSMTEVGSGFAAPSGVAVDGGGNVFVADSGNIYEIPLWSTAAPIQLFTGLGNNPQLAVDGIGDLYVSDPSSGRVVKLWNLGAAGSGLLAQSESVLAGFTAPSAIAVDSSNNLYVADGASLIEISPSGTSTLLSNLSGVNGLAVDASGAVYIASSGGTRRVPSVGGALDSGSATTIASSVTNPAGVAIDRLGNVYISDATAMDVHEVQTMGTLNFGTLSTVGSTATLPAGITNTGNSPLTVTGFTATNAPGGGSTSYFPAEADYSPTDVNCEGAAVAAGANCSMNIEFNPGPGDQGTLLAAISIQDNAANGAVGIDTTGVGAPLASATVSFSLGSSSEAINTTLTATVTATSGSEIPSGEVTVYYPSPTTSLDSKGNPVNQTLTESATLNNGKVTFTLAPVAAGTTTFTVSYQGDRIFGKTSLTSSGNVAKSNVQGLVLPAANSVPYFIQQQNGSTPYDGSNAPWMFSLPVTVATKSGIPTGTLQILDSGSVACPAQAGAGTPSLDATGSIQFATSCLPMATGLTYTPFTSTHVLTLKYEGDSNFNSYSYPTSINIIALRSPGVLITAVNGKATTVSSTDGSAASATAITVAAGSSTTANLTLSSILGYGIQGSNQQLNNYTFPLTLTCDNLPPHATCTFTYPTPDANISTAFDINGCDKNGSAPASPNPYQLTGRGCEDVQVNVTINTNVAVTPGTTSQNSQPAPWKSGGLLVAGLAGMFFSRKARRGFRAMTMGMVALFFLGAAMLGTAACSTTNLSPGSVLTTPAGNYNVTITAQQVGTLVVTGSGTPTTITGSQNQDSVPFTLGVTVQ